MSRLFLQIALGLLLALVIATGLASQLLRVQMDRGSGGLAPMPVEREANLIHWSLIQLDGPAQLKKLTTLRDEFPVDFKLVGSEDLPSAIESLLPSSGPIFQQFQKEKTVYLWLGEENGTLALGPYRHRTPFRLSQLLLILGVILPIVGIAAYLLAAPVVGRLRELERASFLLGKGDLKARVEFEAKDATGDLARQFNQMAGHIEKLLETQKHLLGAVSHELRSPISRIEFLLEAVQASDDPQERDRKVEDIRGELTELNELVRELLLFTRFDSMTETPPRVLTPVAPLIEDAVARFTHRTADRNIKVLIHLNPGFRFPLNSNNFRRVLENLVSNAMKYSTGNVEIECREEEAHLLLVVEDDGPGIPAAVCHRIFEPFFRVDEDRSRQSGGVGLGLAITKRILDSHGGSITAGPAQLGGTRMTTRWPRSDTIIRRQ